VVRVESFAGGEIGRGPNVVAEDPPQETTAMAGFDDAGLEKDGLVERKKSVAEVATLDRRCVPPNRGEVGR
jgi:hypothetical protein